MKHAAAFPNAESFCRVLRRFLLAQELNVGAMPASTLGDLVSMGTLAAFMVVCFSVWYLRVKEPNLPRPFRVPALPLIALLGILGCGYLISTMPLHIFKFLMVWLGVGMLIYFAYGHRHSALEVGADGKVLPAKKENIRGGPPTDE